MFVRNKILLLLMLLVCAACTNGASQNVVGSYGYAGDVKYIEVNHDYMQEFNKKTESEQINILSEVATSPEKLEGIRSIDFNKNYLRSPQDEIKIDDKESKIIIQHNSEKIFDKEVKNKDIFIVNEKRAIVVIDGVLSDVDILKGKTEGFKVSKYLLKDSTEFKTLNKQYSEEYASVEKEKAEESMAAEEAAAKEKERKAEQKEDRSIETSNKFFNAYKIVEKYATIGLKKQKLYEISGDVAFLEWSDDDFENLKRDFNAEVNALKLDKSFRVLYKDNDHILTQLEQLYIYIQSN